MKISAYHKRGGHEVRLLTDYDRLNDYDKVYVSKVFTDTQVPTERLARMPHVEYGGTGFFWALPFPMA